MRKHYTFESGIKSSEITDKEVYRQRRQIIKATAAIGIGSTLGSLLSSDALAGKKLAQPVTKSKYIAMDRITDQEIAQSYTNFYELGLDKTDGIKNAHMLKTQPWSVTVDGECDKPGTYTLEDILKPHTIEERVYRHRCVEAWSMVIPWNGFSLGDLLKRFEPNSKARYVRFETIYDPVNLEGQRYPVIDWPYVEGLRMDEAMHPLSMLVVGMYGEVVPNQNGAPLRLIVPWKYGFKGIKSIVKISFVKRQPKTSWNELAPNTYGFYSNVNPDVFHTRWRQNKERRLTNATGGFLSLFAKKIDTQLFNGYAEEVAHLYSGMDLDKHF